MSLAKEEISDVMTYSELTSHKPKIIYGLIKRIGDILLSFLGLLLLSPLLLILWLTMKMSEPNGSLLFSQIRVGKNGKTFKMYKIRSMHMDAEAQLEKLLIHNEIDGAMFKMKDDPRVTKIGKFIRKTSIDELPQLFNVLQGHMSLVGPRPPLPREVAQYTDYQKQRLQVRPGCTGLWQVSKRNNCTFQEMVELDLKYIREQNFLYGISLIFRTVWVMIRPNGAS